MANYESVIITRQDLTPTQVSGIVSDLTDSLTSNGGQVVRVDNWGLKNLAYRIKKNRKGYYNLLNISAPAAAIAEYQRLLKLNEDVIRFMTIKVEEFGKEISSSSKESVEE
ncbi:MAG: 30S ribosomal protein S6 [Alphaproteobacteria bacterium]